MCVCIYIYKLTGQRTSNEAELLATTCTKKKKIYALSTVDVRSCERPLYRPIRSLPSSTLG